VTPQEEQLLNSLVERVNQTNLQEKDSDAEALLNRGMNGNADAIYILSQTVLVQNIALEQAKAQVAQLQQQVQQARQPARATSFLGNLLGHHDPAPPPPPQPQYLPPQQQGYVPPPPPPPGYDPQYQAAQSQQGQYAPASQPSFMRGAMQTAAGVAAGALAFEGVEAVLHGIGGFGHGGYGMGMGGFGMGSGMGMMGGGFERPMEENIVNNYYDQPGGQEHSEHAGYDQGGVQHFHETADQGNAQFTDASYNTTGNDQGDIDDGNLVDNSQDDSTSQDDTIAQDDGSGFDDGGGDSGGGFDNGGGGGGDFS
jgi:hypothetical protein